MVSNKKSIIVLNKTNLDLKKLNSNYNIGVEGGCISLIEQHQKLDIAISDFDHISEDEKDLIKKNANDFVVLNTEKDNLDGECAIIKAIELGYSDITCVYSNNNRVDLNFSIISFVSKYNVKYLSEKSFIFLLSKDNFIKKSDFNLYNYISIFPLTDIIITISGLKYECRDLKLLKFETMAFSNSFTNSLEARINLEGEAIIIFTND